MIDTKVDTHGLKLMNKTLRTIKAEMPKAYYSALNRTRQHVKTAAAKKVRQTYQIRYGDVNKEVTFRKATLKDLSTELRWKGSNIPLSKFRINPKERRTKPPKVLKAAVKRGGMKPVRGAFVAKVGKGGHVGAFKRLTRRRLPIQELYGPAIPVMVNEPGVLDHMQDVAKKRMVERLDHEIKRRLGQEGVRKT